MQKVHGVVHAWYVMIKGICSWLVVIYAWFFVIMKSHVGFKWFVKSTTSIRICFYLYFTIYHERLTNTMKDSLKPSHYYKKYFAWRNKFVAQSTNSSRQTLHNKILVVHGSSCKTCEDRICATKTNVVQSFAWWRLTSHKGFCFLIFLKLIILIVVSDFDFLFYYFSYIKLIIWIVYVTKYLIAQDFSNFYFLNLI